METSEKPSYEKFEAMKKLGDRAFSGRQYEKAIEFYEKALQYFNIPNHPKYLAVFEMIRKAKKELAARSSSATVKGYVENGLIKPLKIYIRLYSNRQIPQENWQTILVKALIASYENHPQLEKIVDLTDSNSQTYESWEYVPYFDDTFKHVASERGQTYFESLVASTNPTLCRLFSSDISFSDDVRAQGLIIVVVFGDELAGPN